MTQTIFWIWLIIFLIILIPIIIIFFPLLGKTEKA